MLLSDELSKLAELHANARLTDAEYVHAKRRLLGKEPTPSDEPLVSAVNTFRRSGVDKWVGGVCGGTAKTTGVESWIWRLLFVLLFVFAGAGLFLYVLLWLFVPREPGGQEAT